MCFSLIKCFIVFLKKTFVSFIYFYKTVFLSKNSENIKNCLVLKILFENSFINLLLVFVQEFPVYWLFF